MTSPIALLTDFGTQDSYVGVMKGVIAGIAPAAPVIDLSHEIRPQDVAHGAYTLAIAAPYFPAGTIFCAVVDPGVGSERRAVAVALGDWRFVLPDNGLLTRLLDRWPAHQAVTLSAPRYQLPHVSATFHGRDLFAPAAAHLAAGVSLPELGEPLPVAALQRLPLPGTRREGDRLVGSVQHVDHFGNLITTLHRDDLGGHGGWRIRVEGTGLAPLPLARTFADVAVGEPVAYLGSDGFVELAVRNGDAARAWGLSIGARIDAEPSA